MRSAVRAGHTDGNASAAHSIGPRGLGSTRTLPNIAVYNPHNPAMSSMQCVPRHDAVPGGVALAHSWAEPRGHLTAVLVRYGWLPLRVIFSGICFEHWQT